MVRLLTTLVYFLGNVLGPDYEITLYDLEAEAQSLIAIANGRVSGQTIGSPLPEVARGLLSQKQYEQGDCVLNFTSHLQANGKAIRSSAMFIKDRKGRPVGMLGINFDDSRFLTQLSGLLDLIHPRDFLSQCTLPGFEGAAPAPAAGAAPWRETIHNDVSEMIQEIFSEVAHTCSAPPDRLTQEERVMFIAQLKERGIFRLRGSVQYVAKEFGCSQASVYRYLNRAKLEGSE